MKNCPICGKQIVWGSPETPSQYTVKGTCCANCGMLVEKINIAHPDGTGTNKLIISLFGYECTMTYDKDEVLKDKDMVRFFQCVRPFAWRHRKAFKRYKCNAKGKGNMRVFKDFMIFLV